MSNPFEAAIRWLNSGISEWTKEERKFWHEHPFAPPTDNTSLRSSIRVLEAAAKVPADDLRACSHCLNECDQAGEMLNMFTALLAALPGAGND